MSTLGAELQKTIRNLEKLRDSQHSLSDELLSLLDKLYEQQIELIDAAIKKDTPKYIAATHALSEAAARTHAAINDLATLDKAIKKVADAIGKITRLLAAVA